MLLFAMIIPWSSLIISGRLRSGLRSGFEQTLERVVQLLHLRHEHAVLYEVLQDKPRLFRGGEAHDVVPAFQLRIHHLRDVRRRPEPEPVVLGPYVRDLPIVAYGSVSDEYE